MTLIMFLKSAADYFVYFHTHFMSTKIRSFFAAVATVFSALVFLAHWLLLLRTRYRRTQRLVSWSSPEKALLLRLMMRLRIMEYLLVL
ncbi:hypothetical protein AY547_06175 [Corynebacterium diphtheriae bv. gravis]|nr:hypothetical protein AY476_10820 [Corynebacterium diphtheriae bv. mitis]OWN10314.1 hypothetical protein AY479_09540 [Corynebacterium belfantii]OWN49637.1 hypothetical protein AY491_08190 [Corynebacterium diphtheriae bv. gravis]OWN08948.1 hypothetical protein AY474_02855 [Corynebacterium diphtheriae bv. mitis]OWN15989.1 hypothetical protein AY493_10070 [Corynebacterium diphtheriae bv. mitis]